jgi:cytidylate kinase
VIVAIDGPAGAGKSTVARALADALGLVLLDTGAMYRAVTWRVLESDVDIHDAAACASVAAEVQLSFDSVGIVVDGVSREQEIRSRAVDQAVSVVAAHPAVRAAIVPNQRVVAESGAVAEGRDTTTVVFPEADHRFFLSASARERARRRASQRGDGESIEVILADIQRRDHLDSTREDSPLKRGEGVMVVDTDGLSAEEVVSKLLDSVRGASA